MYFERLKIEANALRTTRTHYKKRERDSHKKNKQQREKRSGKMASALLMNCGTKVRSVVIGHISPLSSRTMFAAQSQYSTTTSNGSDANASADGTGAIDKQTTKSIKRAQTIKNVPDNEIKKSVFISQSNDIFTNLALEDWFYRHFDFTNHHVLMLWSNDPCVVVGRHQNPFYETNVSNLQRAGIALARRNSGGGAVFHDRGNLNMTFFSPRERYNRSYNLSIVTRALFREWGIKADISARDDIVISNKKVKKRRKKNK